MIVVNDKDSTQRYAKNSFSQEQGKWEDGKSYSLIHSSNLKQQ